MKKLISILTLLLLLTSCGSMKVYVNHDSTYSRKNPITIVAPQDKSGTIGELQFLLQSNGYKLMSYSAAKKALNLDSEYDDNKSHQELTNTISFNSAYVLELNYNYDWDLRYIYNNFSANITDLRTGEIVMSASFRGEKGCKSVLEDLVEQMNKVIK